MGPCHRGYVFIPRSANVPFKLWQVLLSSMGYLNSLGMSHCKIWPVLARMFNACSIVHCQPARPRPCPQVLAIRAHSPLPSPAASSQVSWPLVTQISILNFCSYSGQLLKSNSMVKIWPRVPLFPRAFTDEPWQSSPGVGIPLPVCPRHHGPALLGLRAVSALLSAI